MMKIGMLNLLGNIPTRLNSHNAGWTFCLASIIEHKTGIYPDFIKNARSIKDYTHIVLNNGINYKEDQWNFFGGVSEETVEKLDLLSDHDVKLYSYNEKVNFGSLLKRKEITSVPNKDVILRSTTNSDKLILGDSHSLSIYEKGYGINRIDGKTLYGFLKDPYSYFDKDKVKKLVLYFGNIDIRFHIDRQKNAIKSLELLCLDYIRVIDDIMSNNIDVKIQGLLPIEDESRRIPKTGYYKGQPFYGSQERREEYRTLFNSFMKDKSKLVGYTFSNPWLEYPLDFNFMESRQSVHIRPEYYLNKDSFIC